MLYPYSSFRQVQCSLRSPWASIIGMHREVQHLLWESTWDQYWWGCSAPSIWSQKECSCYCCCTPHPLASGYQNVQARFGGPTGRSSGLPCCSGSKLPSPAPDPLHIVSLRATDGSGCRTPTHPSGTLLVGLRGSAPSKDPSGESLSTSNEVQGWIEQRFLLKVVHWPPRV